ncbi:nicotinamide/nicotinate mononucleotide adenylyltransferase [Synechococcus phage S-CBWM1]|uniref:Nicotinamide/nicotinate mononucleotide adenylyltransferase n=1 Tax=Synechococcus phage S-CBWM1 TaxID=2053653 RepID=A0A3G1L3G1_9CAUD|nr:nicotinamide/nicotinate mononucleotide adenylyltransferase [Synechococcus phage S-CBWM1]ATW62723.1 nicotinamide/nicotinate mononucleotide adenylyltransferase [Synechococcus phage S-CBWM1]
MLGHIDPAVLDYVLTLDFTRCERPDGTAYGTAGTCRKGVERPLAEAVVQGRFNLSHSGHAKFIAKVLDQADKVNVVISSQEGERPGGVDGKAGNLNSNFRRLMLREALRAEGVDMERVSFIVDDSPIKTIRDMVSRHPKEKVGVFLGKDPKNGEYADRLAKEHGIKGGLVTEDTAGSVSSTSIRKAIDSGDMASLRKIMKENPYMLRLAIAGRRLEMGG